MSEGGIVISFGDPRLYERKILEYIIIEQKAAPVSQSSGHIVFKFVEILINRGWLRIYSIQRTWRSI